MPMQYRKVSQPNGDFGLYNIPIAGKNARLNAWYRKDGTLLDYVMINTRGDEITKISARHIQRLKTVGKVYAVDVWDVNAAMSS